MASRRKQPAKQRSVGIALGAGGARGLAHIGVLHSLIRGGVKVNSVVGSSVGALVGAAFAAGQLENFEREVRAMEWPDVLRMFDPVWPRAGLMAGTRTAERLTHLLGDWRIEDLPIPFAAVAVDLVTGEEVHIREGRVIDAIRASISIPGIFVPHQQGKRFLVDGALRNPVPVSALNEFKPDLRIAVNLHAQPVREIDRGFRSAAKSRSSLFDTIENGLSKFRRSGKSAEAAEAEAAGGPNLFEILTSTMSVVEYELARHRLAHEAVDFILTPDVHGIRTFEFHKAKRAIRAGQSAAEEQLEAIVKQVNRRPGLIRRRRSS